MSIERIAVLGGGAWGTALALDLRARRPQRDAVGVRRRQCRTPCRQAREPVFAGRAPRRWHQGHAGACRSGARRGDPAGGASTGDALRGQGAGADNARRHAGDRLRQGHRTRHAQIHDRDRRRMRAECDAGDSFRAELCRRCRARAADRGGACDSGRKTGRGAGARDRFRHLPPLSFDRCARRRGRRRGKECAGDRGGHRHRARARRQRRGGADHARLCRTCPLRHAPSAPGRRR